MSNAKAVSRSLLFATALAAAAVGAPASPAAAAAAGAPCQVDGENVAENGDRYEWSLHVTFRSKGVSCAQAKTVMRACGNGPTVAGWRVTQTSNGGIRFSNRANPKRRFNVMGAGGSPRCIVRILDL